MSNKPRKRRRKTSGTRTIHLDGLAAEAMRKQLQAFEEKFGRPPGPKDPVFFDPDLDVPTPITPVKMEAAMVQGMQTAGLDPAFVYAYQHTGLLVTEMNKDKLSEEDLEEWFEAVAKYKSTHDELQSPEHAKEELVQLVIFMTDCILNDQAKVFFDCLTELFNAEDDGLTIAMVMSILMSWLVGAKDLPITEETREEAIAVALENSPGPQAQAVKDWAGLLGADSGRLTIGELAHRHDDSETIVAMWLLVVGLAQSYGASRIQDALKVMGIPEYPGD